MSDFSHAVKEPFMAIQSFRLYLEVLFKIQFENKYKILLKMKMFSFVVTTSLEGKLKNNNSEVIK